jgi:hypothetical protein
MKRFEGEVLLSLVVPHAVGVKHMHVYSPGKVQN